MKLDVAGLSDKGRKKEKNEIFLAFSEPNQQILSYLKMVPY
jgi:hypothetical protein